MPTSAAFSAPLNNKLFRHKRVPKAMKLYSYWRSSAAYRVRIALNLKDLEYDLIPTHLIRGGGEHRQPDYLALNPQGLVPVLDHDGVVLTQSLAIIEYLDEVFPNPPLLPAEAGDRAKVRAIAQLIACEMHPLNNLRVLQYLRQELQQDKDAVDEWYRHWVAVGFEALEKFVGDHGDAGHCFGDRVTLADVCLVPQVFNARRFECDITPYPELLRVAENLEKQEAFVKAAPQNQPDAED